MKNLRSYLLENMEELKSLVWDINSWNGSLEYLEVWENDEYTINEIFTNPYEALRSSYYGGYNINDDYFKFNAYGNIESLNNYDYEEELKDNIEEIIEALLEVYNHLDINEELWDLIENTLNEEEEEE
jgi:hypothetical protein